MNKPGFSRWVAQSHVGRIMLLGILVLVLQIPVASIENLVFERQTTEGQAKAEIQEKWGQQQQLVGPVLLVPYRVKTQIQDPHSGVKETKIEIRRAVFLPEQLEVSSQLRHETRYRGIFEVPLYQATVTVNGSFKNPDLKLLDLKPEEVLWNKARLVVFVSDARAIQKQAKVNWNGEEHVFEPGSDESTTDYPGYHLDLEEAIGTGDNYSFDIEFVLNGSNGFYFAPLGKDSVLSLRGTWPDPSFQGKWLPNEREVSADGFISQWRIPYLSRNFPQQAAEFSSIQDNVYASLVGVALISPIDNYRMSERSIKYEILFFVLTFSAIWLLEVLARLRVHLMQYLFIGAGLCLFYLLELSLSEHLGFYWAYAIATAAIVSMVSLYSCVVLRTGKRAAFIGVSLTVLYLYLFTLLREQNYSLLIGSVGLFLILSLIMFVTRRVDWFAVVQLPAEKKQSVQPVPL